MTEGREETMTDTASAPIAGELVPYDDEPRPAPMTLFGTKDPLVALERMAAIATPLSELVHDRKLFVRIRGNEYLYCSAWKTLGGMLGIAPYTVWTRPNETGDGYVARVEVRTFDERTISAAEAECSRAENRWAKAEPHALRAMAETRATSRALRGPLEQIVVLAGYQGTPAEEMPFDSGAQPKSRAAVTPVEPSREQWFEIETLIRSLQGAEPRVDWKARSQELAGMPARMLTKTGAEMLIEKLQAELVAVAGDSGR
jgi:hypothetical protein